MVERRGPVSGPERQFKLYCDYDRRKVHDVLAPDTDKFTLRSRQWGRQGIVSIAERPGDFVFFVTSGQSQGGHVFDEGLTAEGVLTWQSQPQQKLQHPQIRSFIAHDELTNSIYLFLRSRARAPYTSLAFSVWMRAQVMELHGLDLAAPMPLPELVLSLHG